MPHTIFIIIVAIIGFNYLLERLLDYLNNTRWSAELPKELAGIYDAEKYKKSQAYHRELNGFGLLTGTISLLVMLALLFLDGFAWLDDWVRSYSEHPVWMTLIFFGALSLASSILGTPFSLYSIFVIEEKYGFNKTTLRTYFLDKFKGTLLGAVIGGSLLSLIVWFYMTTGPQFWLYAWGLVTAFSLFMNMFYTTLIVPIFNKLSPLAEGELRNSIEAYCKKVGFKLDNLFVMDGSRRSTKANAYFTGLGGRKKIVLYDTLIEKHPQDELVSVLAHEVGHYKKKHTLASLALSVLTTGLMLYVLSLLIDNPALPAALGSQKASFHLSVLAFGLLYSPLSLILGVIMNYLSRRNEFQADAYASETYGAAPLQSALKKLSVDNLSNLRPHPMFVFFYHSHPPLLQRLESLNNRNP